MAKLLHLSMFYPDLLQDNYYSTIKFKRNFYDCKAHKSRLYVKKKQNHDLN